MEMEEAGQRYGGIVNYFQGATIHNITINSGILTKNGDETHHYNAAEHTGEGITAVTKSEQDVKTAIEEMLKEMGEDEKPLFRNKKQWWAVFRVLSKYLNYPNKMTEFVTKINNLNIEQDDRIAISYDSLSAAPKDVPQMSCSPDAWDALKNKSENYMNQYAVADYLMVRLGIKS